MQLFLLPEIDREATKARVEEALEATRFYRQFGALRREMKTTPSYMPRYHGATNAVGQPAEDIAVANVDHEQRLETTAVNMERAVAKLGMKEREIIRRRYLCDEPDLDYLIFPDMKVSERAYYRIKATAFYKLAFMLRLEVYIEKNLAQ